jgi:hypothetical protein
MLVAGDQEEKGIFPDGVEHRHWDEDEKKGKHSHQM